MADPIMANKRITEIEQGGKIYKVGEDTSGKVEEATFNEEKERVNGELNNKVDKTTYDNKMSAIDSSLTNKVEQSDIDTTVGTAIEVHNIAKQHVPDPIITTGAAYPYGVLKSNNNWGVSNLVFTELYNQSERANRIRNGHGADISILYVNNILGITTKYNYLLIIGQPGTSSPYVNTLIPVALATNRTWQIVNCTDWLTLQFTDKGNNTLNIKGTEGNGSVREIYGIL
jgi:hypothetical protein